MPQGPSLVTEEHCSVLINNLRPSELVSAHLPNALLTQRLGDINVTHQSKVTHRGLSQEAGLFSSTNVPGETFHCSKRFTIFQEEGTVEGLFDKDPVPPPPEIQNSTAPPSSPGEPIESGVFNDSNWSEYIALVRNQGREVDDDMEPAPKNVRLVDTNADNTLFEGQTWGWYGIDCRAVVAQNQNEHSFKNGWTPQSLSYINIFLHYILLRLLIIILIP